MKRRTFIKSVAFLGAAQALTNRAFGLLETSWHEFMRPMMGSFVSIAIAHQERDQAQAIIFDCFAELDRRIAEISNWAQDSALNRLNLNRSLNTRDIPATLRDVLRVAQEVSKLSRGHYNPLCLGLTAQWRQAMQEKSVLDKAEVTQQLSIINSSRLQVGANALKVLGNATIDLDSISQGFIADCACEYLKQHGVKRGRIDCGGELRFIGENTWRVELQDPRSENTKGFLKVHGDVGIGTSGDYRNFWFVNGKRYHHLIDLKSGFPGELCQQVTIVAKTAAMADALASAVFLMPLAQASALISSLPGVLGLIITQAGTKMVANGQFATTEFAEFNAERYID